MTLQLLRRTALKCRHKTGGLLPHLLTLTTTGRHGGYFSSTLLYPRGQLLLGSRMLCVARTFLMRTRRKRQTDQLLWGAKIEFFSD